MMNGKMTQHQKQWLYKTMYCTKGWRLSTNHNAGPWSNTESHHNKSKQRPPQHTLTHITPRVCVHTTDSTTTKSVALHNGATRCRAMLCCALLLVTR